MVTRCLCLLLLLASAAYPFSAAGQSAAAPLILQYDSRPPFLMGRPDGSVDGVVAAPAVAAMRKAGIPIVWRHVSPTRQLANLRANAQAMCSVGFYKTPEREAYARYSKAIYQDAPMIGLANSGLSVPPEGSVEQLLAREDVTVLMKQSNVYGPYLDARFAAMKAQRITSYEDYPQLIRLVHLGRVQITFVHEEEAEYYVSGMGYSKSDFRFIHFTGMPAGEKRYIICSRKVDPALMARIDAALK
jgi:uncharacterized protein (TIGR02285 family)